MHVSPPAAVAGGAGPGFRRRLVAILCAVSLPLVASAHSFTIPHAEAAFDEDGSYRVRIEFDLIALLGGVEPRDLTDAQVAAFSRASPAEFRATLAAAGLRLTNELHVLTQDGSEFSPVVLFPPEDEILRTVRESVQQQAQPSNLYAEFTGSLPADAREVRLQFPAVLGSVAVRVVAGTNEPLNALHLPEEIGPPFPLSIQARMPVSRLGTAWRYTVLGFEHILPKGLDHILFVLGLFLLSPKIRPLLWQVTAFTIAHSITLALAMYGVVDLPSSIVEPAIALSIAFIAFENLFTKKLHPWRPAVVFLFGLIHGLGFAGVLLELGLPREAFATALVAFNVGVEAGQLAVLTLAFAVTGWFLKRDWYRPFVAMPASLLIALTGLMWTYDRIFG